MAPIKSSLARSGKKLIGFFNQTDLSLRGAQSVSRLKLFGASGGNVDGLEPGNGYAYHTFTSPGQLIVDGAPKTVDILMVGGGGHGGGFGGGGGAGGLIYYPNMELGPGIHAVSIGDGSTAPGPSAGGDTTFAASPSPYYLIAKGGGYGAGAGQVGGDGGSSGGGSRAPTAAGTATQPTQPGNSATYGFGTAGGTGEYGDGGNTKAGGGGGAGGAGTPQGSGSAGGVGKQYPAFTGPLIGVPALAPLNGYFAGGGGGGSEPSGPAAGGAGGGGAGGKGPGAATGTGSDAVTNSGGGGGGGGSIPGLGYPGGDGGPGILVVRYTV